MNTINEMKRSISACRSKLVKSPETARRYERASRGARVLMSYLAWAKDNRKEVDSEVARKYRDRLFKWVSLREFAFVLQAETDMENVALLKAGIVQAMERETAPERIERKPKPSDVRREYLGLPETAFRSFYPATCFFQAMGSGRKWYAYSVITGDTPNIGWAFHPDFHAYCQWAEEFSDERDW